MFTRLFSGKQEECSHFGNVTAVRRFMDSIYMAYQQILVASWPSSRNSFAFSPPMALLPILIENHPTSSTPMNDLLSSQNSGLGQILVTKSSLQTISGPIPPSHASLTTMNAPSSASLMIRASASSSMTTKRRTGWTSRTYLVTGYTQRARFPDTLDWMASVTRFSRILLGD